MCPRRPGGGWVGTFFSHFLLEQLQRGEPWEPSPTWVLPEPRCPGSGRSPGSRRAGTGGQQSSAELPAAGHSSRGPQPCAEYSGITAQSLETAAQRCGTGLDFKWTSENSNTFPSICFVGSKVEGRTPPCCDLFQPLVPPPSSAA